MNFGFRQQDLSRFPTTCLHRFRPTISIFPPTTTTVLSAYFSVSQPIVSTAKIRSVLATTPSRNYIILFGNDDEIVQNIDTEIVIGNNSKLSFYVCCAGTSASTVNHKISFKIGSDTTVMFSNAAIAGKSVATYLTVDFLGLNSAFESPAILMPWQDESFKFESVINHNVPRCTSQQTVRTVVDGNGVSDFYGLIKVAQNSQKSETEQVNNNILLSADAHAFSKPQLEIYADDVKCSHGSTTGMLDKEALFYMRSRGISETTAQNLLIEAFIQEIVDKVAPADYKAYLEELIALKLGLRSK